MLPVSAYDPLERVWVWRHDSTSWRPGVVLGIGALATIVTFRPASGRGEMTDTVMPDRLAPRAAKAAAEPEDQAE